MPTFADVDDLPDPFGAEEEYLSEEEEPPFEPYDMESSTASTDQGALWSDPAHTKRGLKYPPDGEPCRRPGCLSHITHPCEGCGRLGGYPVRKWIDLQVAAAIRPLKDQESFISFLANRLSADGLTKAQIIRMADRLMHGGTWDGEKVVLEERTPLEMAQERILKLEAEVDRLTDQLASLIMA